MAGGTLVDSLPMTATLRLELEAFHQLGLLQSLRTCRDRLDGRRGAVRLQQLGAALGAGAGVPPAGGHQGSAASWLALGWGAFALLLVTRSLLGVAAVPRKREGDGATPQELNLADEEGAWQRGFWYWAGLAWADGLMGRYGKCLSTTAVDAELVKDRADSDYEPHQRFRRAWDEQIQRAGSMEGASLVWALQRVIGAKGCALLVAAVVVEVATSMVGMTLALDVLLGNLQAAYDAAVHRGDQQIPLLAPTAMIIVLVFGVPMVCRAASVVVTLLDGYYTNLCAAGLASVVYEKALVLPAGGDAAAAAALSLCGRGHEEEQEEGSAKPCLRPNAVQLLNVDIIEAWGYLLKTLVYTAVSPFACAALLTMLVMRMRLAGVVGALYMVPVLGVTWLVQTLNVASWKQYQGHQDRRLDRLSEALQHIRAVKALSWERLAHRRIGEARERELEASFACAVTSGCTQANLHSVPWFSMAITLVFAGVLYGRVEARHIFVVQRIMLSLLSLLHVVSFGVQKSVSVPNSLARIKAFLLQPERPKNVVREPALDRQAPAVRLVGSFSFDPSGEPVLRGLDLAIPRGELVAVIGGVGAGKSALLLAAVGELFPRGPRPVVEAPSGVAYCAQSPWIFEGTLRENVTLNQVHEQDRYHRALRAAALLPDLQTLPGGDLATIGSFGIRLSGGQRARVALARAAYMERAELVLLDDPFASIDAATAQHVLNELLLGPAMQNRTRIVVTQPHVARLNRFDRIILLEEGRVAAVGPPNEVIASAAFTRLLQGGGSGAGAGPAGAEGGMRSGGGGPSAARPRPASPAAASLPPASPPQPPPAACLAAPCSPADDSGVLAPGAALAKGTAGSPVVALREPEVQDRFAWSTVRMWLRAAGYGNLVVFFVLVLLQRLLFLGESLVVATWVDRKMVGEAGDRFFICTLLVVVTACCLSFVLLYWAAGRLSQSASREVHERVLAALLRAPIDRFFDKQPVGRILNRFSYDLRHVDSAVAFCVMMLVAFCSGFVVTQGYILSAVHWSVATCALPVYALLFYYVHLFRGTAVPLVFHSKFALSCIQDLQGVVLCSCVSIRANGMRADFMARHNHYSASIIRCQYLTFHVAKAWVQSRVALCFSSLTALFALSGLWSHMPMGTLSNIISLSFMAMCEFETISLVFVNFVTVLTSLQRVASLASAPQEAPLERAGDPVFRLSAAVERSELAALEVHRGAQVEASLPDSAEAADRSWLHFGDGGGARARRTALAVFSKGLGALLRASEDGGSLELLPGRRLGDLAPGSQALEGVDGGYHVAAVSGVARSASCMADELCNPPATVWLDLWAAEHARGVRVQLQDLSAGYGGDPSVLRGVSLDVPARARVGLTGRTGSGKTTVLLCILRVLEPRSGRILLNGLDASKLGLAALRAAVGVVPQDSAVFAGTWRLNVDPFGAFPDGRLWEALQAASLMPHVRALPGGLDAAISRDGANLSAGHRQLLGLARMLVRQPPVLLLDECTSSLDPHTQDVVRNAIASDFTMSTVIAAAHRMEMLQGFDQVVVLEGGAVAKQHAPDDGPEA